MTELLQTVVTVVLFVVILGGLVLVHEVGHFITARLAKVRVLEFGIGFPPRAKVLGRGKPPAYDRDRPPPVPPALPPGIAPGSREADEFLALAAERDAARGGTLYTLHWLPIGGFVKLEGEDGDEADDPHSFTRARLPVKLGILAAGAAMNLLVSLVIFTGLALGGDPALGLQFQKVVDGSPAQAVGLVAGDTIVSIDGRRYAAFDNDRPIEDLRANAGRTVVLGVLHVDGRTEDVTVTLRVPEDANQGALGITDGRYREVGQIRYAAGDALAIGAKRTVGAFGLILGGLADLGRSIVRDPTTAPPAAGPVGIAAEIGDVFWSLGPIYVLFLAGLLSANLALVNVLPFPPLDGGRILVIVLKSVVGERISVRAERLTYFVGFLALFTFLIWITYFDIARQIGGGTP